MSASRTHRQRLYEQLVGTTIAGRFRIKALLGFGGMGAVYEAVQHNMQRSVALKVIPSHDPTTTARFEREALTISQLHHPNTVTVFDYGKTDQGVLFLAMEMLSGQTLSDLIKRRGVLTPNEAVHIATQVCRSLSEAHRANIVHRDVKPDNIFLIKVDEDPHFVKVLDFGIAKILQGEDHVELTGDGRIIGTPKYMSPEQILAETVDHRSDIYSLGCIVFEMLCGSPPFQDTNTTRLMIAHAQQPPPTFAERLPHDALNRIPGPLEAVVRRALSKSPDTRFRDIDEFRDALQTALDATAHHIRVAEIADVTQVQSAAAVSRELTDSQDLLSLYSSQTLNKLKPAALPGPPAPNPAEHPASGIHPQLASGVHSQPMAAPQLTHDGGAPEASKSGRTPLIAIVVAAVIVVGLGVFLLLKPTADNPQDPGEPAPLPAQPVAQEAISPTHEALQADLPPAPARVSVRVVSEPAGAQVYEEGRNVGRTPMTIHGDDGSVLHYSFELKGYQPLKASYTLDAAQPEPVFTVAMLPEAREAAPAHQPSRPTRPARPATPTRAPAEKHSEPEPKPEPPTKPVKPHVPKLEDDNVGTTIPRL